MITQDHKWAETCFNVLKHNIIPATRQFIFLYLDVTLSLSWDYFNMRSETFPQLVSTSIKTDSPSVLQLVHDDYESLSIPLGANCQWNCSDWWKHDVMWHFVQWRGEGRSKCHVLVVTIVLSSQRAGTWSDVWQDMTYNVP